MDDSQSSQPRLRYDVFVRKKRERAKGGEEEFLIVLRTAKALLLHLAEYLRVLELHNKVTSTRGFVKVYISETQRSG